MRTRRVPGSESTRTSVRTWTPVSSWAQASDPNPEPRAIVRMHRNRKTSLDLPVRRPCRGDAPGRFGIESAFGFSNGDHRTAAQPLQPNHGFREDPQSHDQGQISNSVHHYIG